MNPYTEALQFIKRHPGTGGAGSLAKLVLSLYNSLCGYSFAECVSNLDHDLTRLALRMAEDYAKNGETEELCAAGKILADDLYPGLWEMGIAMRNAREATREKWRAQESKEESDRLDAAEAALFTDPAKLIPAGKARKLLDKGDALYAYYRIGDDWRYTKLTRQAAVSAIEVQGKAQLSNLCPDNGQALAIRIDQRIYYISTDFDAREAYLEEQARDRS